MIMVTYKQKKSSFTWLVGIVVFIVTMVICFSDVYGLDRFEYLSLGNGLNGPEAKSYELSCSKQFSIPLEADDQIHELTFPVHASFPVIPEPATLTLLGLGIGALLVARRRR
jgi:hypothetical protein